MLDEDNGNPPTPARLSGRLTTRWLGRPYEWHASCASTNDVVGGRAREGAAEGLVVATEEQSGGRGRLGRTWHSPAGENLYFSLLLRPTRPAHEIPPLTLLAGAAIATALETLGFRPRLKWPNDVQLVEDEGPARKVAGVLTEMSSEGGRVGHVVVGVGLNVNTHVFPDELVGRATSLRLAGRRQVAPPASAAVAAAMKASAAPALTAAALVAPAMIAPALVAPALAAPAMIAPALAAPALAAPAWDRTEVLAQVLAAFEPLYDDFQARGPVAARAPWQSFAALGERCRVNGPGQALEGIALGVDPDGALRVRDDAGRIHRVLSGEIST